jgi:magnesium-transporting ATPase (P-type)
MTVVAVWTPAGEARVEGSGYEPDGRVAAGPAAESALRALALAAARCSSGHAVERNGEWVAQGDPMEAALDVLARRLGLDAEVEAQAAPIARRFPFDPRRRRMSVLAGDWLFVKGAPDAILPRCVTDGAAAAALDRLAGQGLRVIAVARRAAGAVPAGAEADQAERELELLGLVGLEDPPRPGAAEAIGACRRAGIKVGMITGDHPMTARAIALELGLAGAQPLVLEGRQLPADERLLGELLDRDGVVVSRVSPEDKLRIASALRARGHVVAMTGDGVNDGPALQEADIGIAMGRGGTDVAREASDLVLLDDDFATIVAAVEQGRATFANMRRFLTYHLTDNVAELTPFVVWALSGGSIPLALGVLQILCLDVVTDQLPALALGAEAPGEGLLDQPPRGRHLVDRALLGRVFGLLGPVEALFEMAAFGAVLVALGWQFGAPVPPQTLLAASGAAFAAVIIGQAANGLACRSEHQWAGAPGWWSNPLLLAGIGVEIALLLALLYTEPVAAVLGQAPPPPIGWAVALLTAPALIAADALQKSLARWRSRRAAVPARLVRGS